jgi:glycosyltransferase involved in cell wall biosynthesis
VTSSTTKKEFEQLTNQPISVITNGYDVENVKAKPMDEQFTLAHIGSLLSERNPVVLWEALSELILENADFKAKFQLKLIGAVSAEVIETLQKLNLGVYCNLLGYISHEEALQEQRCSQVLLLIEIDSKDTKCIIPGKLFEYMVSDRPIMALGPKNADFAQILRTTNTGKFFTYTEKKAVKSYILQLFEQYQKGDLKVYPVGLQQYSRKALTKELASLLA